MRESAEKKSQPAHRASVGPTHSRAPVSAPPGQVHPLVDLQRLAGNQAVQRLLQQEPGERSPVGAVPTIVHEVLTAPGQPLDLATRALMERRFGHDFGRVRVHADSRAAESARSVLARAYTVGPHIVFGDGQYAPGTHQGSELLAHELAHTVQQAGVASTQLSVVSDAVSERNAESAGHDIANGRGISTGLQAAAAGLARAPVAIDSPPQEEREVSSKFTPGGFTDEDLDPAHLARRLPPTQAELNEEAARLGEKQARRRKFWNLWDRIEDLPLADMRDAIVTSPLFRKTIADLDLIFTTSPPTVFGVRPRGPKLVRDPSVDLLEGPVMGNAEAKAIYNRAYNGVMNEPEEESGFHKTMLWICEHTNPCLEIIEEQRKNIAGGMSPADAQARSLAKLAKFGVELLAPGQPDDLPTYTTPAPVPAPVARIPVDVPASRVPGLSAPTLPPATGREPAPKPPVEMATRPPTTAKPSKPPTRAKPSKPTTTAKATKPPPTAASAKPAATTEPVQTAKTKQERREMIAERAELAEKARQQSQAAVGQSKTKGSPPMPRPAPSAGPPTQTAQDVISGGTGPLRPGQSDLGQYGIDKYGTYSNRPGDRFAGHELLQNLWLEVHGFGKRLATPASRNNPAIALTHPEHTAVSRAQRDLGLFDRNKLAQMSAKEIIEANANAMRAAGIPEDVIQVLSREALNYAATLKPPMGRSGAGR